MSPTGGKEGGEGASFERELATALLGKTFNGGGSLGPVSVLGCLPACLPASCVEGCRCCRRRGCQQVGCQLKGARADGRRGLSPSSLQFHQLWLEAYIRTLTSHTCIKKSRQMRPYQTFPSTGGGGGGKRNEKSAAARVISDRPTYVTNSADEAGSVYNKNEWLNLSLYAVAAAVQLRVTRLAVVRTIRTVVGPILEAIASSSPFLPSLRRNGYSRSGARIIALKSHADGRTVCPSDGQDPHCCSLRFPRS